MPKKVSTRQTRATAGAAAPSKAEPLPNIDARGFALQHLSQPDLPMLVQGPTEHDARLMERLTQMRAAAGLAPPSEEDRLAVIRDREKSTLPVPTTPAPISPRKRTASDTSYPPRAGPSASPPGGADPTLGRPLEPSSLPEKPPVIIDREELYALVPLRYSGLNPNRKKLTPREYNKYRFGDHSLIATCVAPDLLLNLPSEVGSPTLLRAISKSGERWYHNIVSDYGRIFLSSNFTTTEANGGFGPTTPITALALGSFPPMTNLDTVRPLNIMLGPPIQVGETNAAALMQFYQSGLPSSKLITSALEPVLRPANNQICRYIANDFSLNQRYYDNSTMYAKMFFLALVKDVADAMQTTLSALPFNPDDAPQFINLADPALMSSALDGVISSGKMVLLESLDWDICDLDIIYALANAGQRYWVTGGNRAPFGVAVSWPGIPFSVWYHQAHPPTAPGPTVITSGRLTEFAFRLAVSRAEVSSLLKGFYIAVELLGTTFSHSEDVEPAAWWPLTSQYHCNGGLRLPNMFDYNVLHRSLGLVPQSHLEHQEEIFTYPTLDTETRVLLVALYNSAMRAFTTTTLQDLSITTQDITNWCLALPPRGKVNAMFQQGLSRSVFGFRKEAVGFAAPRMGFKHFLGVEIYHNLYPSQSWNPICVQTPSPVRTTLGTFDPTLPPLLASQLGIDFALVSRPVEWGLVGPEPTISLNQEVVLATVPEKRGWYSNMGTRAYTANDNTGKYYEYVFYAAQVLNAIAQFYKWEQMQYHVVRHVSSPPAIDWSSVLPAGRVPYNQQLHMIEPGQIVTFDWASTEVIAPALVGTDITDAIAVQLSLWCNTTVRGVGYALEQASCDITNLTMPGFFTTGGPALIGQPSDPTLSQTMDPGCFQASQEGTAPGEEPRAQVPPGNCQNI